MVRLIGGHTWRVQDFRPIIFDKLKEINANCLSVAMSSQRYVDNYLDYQLPVPMKRVHYGDQMRLGVQMLKERRLKLNIYATVGPNGQKGWEYYGDVITDETVGDEWIAIWSQVINELRPDSFELMNEAPSARLANNPDLTYDRYRDWAVKCIDTYRAIKPDMNIMLTSLPFADMGPAAENPIPRANVTYSYHLHYFRDPSPPWHEWAAAYDEGRIDDAKILLESHILDRSHVRDAINRRLDLCFVFGTDYRIKPNWHFFLRDMYDFCRRHRINSVFHHSWNTEVHDTGVYHTGVFNAEYTEFNVMGHLMAEELHKAGRAAPSAALGLIFLLGLAALLGRD